MTHTHSTAGGQAADAYEQAARAEGWEKRYSHFTRGGVSIAYVDWKTLCAEEGIQVAALAKTGGAA